MAISEDLPGVEVTVVVDGAPLKEYIDAEPEEEERTVSRYIEAISGKKFEVHLTVRKGTKFLGDALGFEVVTDGKFAQRPLIRKRRCTGKDEHFVVAGMAIASDTAKEFSFSPLELVSDGHALCGESSKFKELGSIEIAIAHEDLEQEVAAPIYQHATADYEGSMISEKALKGQAISHSVKYGQEIKIQDTSCHETVSVAGVPDPYVTFIFHYRSLDALRSMLIIPRTPTPPPLEERDFDTLTPEDIQELQRQVRANKEKGALAGNIKRELAEGNPRPRKKARPSASATQLELDDDGVARASSTPTVTIEPEVIELD